MTHTAQSAACNARHEIDQRLARWLLLSHDRREDDVVPLTHDYIALMLGVRRASVSQAAEGLQRAGLIRYTRGKIVVLDRAGLEAAACECYGAGRADFDRLLG